MSAGNQTTPQYLRPWSATECIDAEHLGMIFSHVADSIAKDHDMVGYAHGRGPWNQIILGNIDTILPSEVYFLVDQKGAIQTAAIGRLVHAPKDFSQIAIKTFALLRALVNESAWQARAERKPDCCLILKPDYALFFHDDRYVSRAKNVPAGTLFIPAPFLSAHEYLENYHALIDTFPHLFHMDEAGDVEELAKDGNAA